MYKNISLHHSAGEYLLFKQWQELITRSSSLGARQIYFYFQFTANSTPEEPQWTIASMDFISAQQVMDSWCEVIHFILTDARSCRPELTYFAGTAL